MSPPGQFLATINTPEFGTIYGNIANAPGDDDAKKVIIWNPAN